MDHLVEREIPVLITGYNRPEFLENQINLVCEKRRLVYVFVDGPKDKNDLGAIRSAQIVMSKEKTHGLRIKVLETNIGCRKSIPTAINWVLTNHNSIIVLEDDIKPSDAFFEFMDFCLKFFAHRKDIFQVSGWAPGLARTSMPPVFLSRHAFGWGWGTWRDRWDKANIELEKIDYAEELRTVIGESDFKTNRVFFKVWRERLARCAEGKDTWDYQWYLSIWMNRGKSITTSKPLASNIGFDQRATRTKSAPRYLAPEMSEQATKEHLSDCLRYLTTQEVLFDAERDKYLDYVLLNVKTGRSIRDFLYNFAVFTVRHFKRVRCK